MQVVAGFGLGVLDVLLTQQARGGLERGHEALIVARESLLVPGTLAAASWPGTPLAGAAMTPPCSSSRTAGSAQRQPADAAVRVPAASAADGHGTSASVSARAIRVTEWPASRRAKIH